MQRTSFLKLPNIKPVFRWTRILEPTRDSVGDVVGFFCHCHECGMGSSWYGTCQEYIVFWGSVNRIIGTSQTEYGIFCIGAKFSALPGRHFGEPRQIRANVKGMLRRRNFLNRGGRRSIRTRRCYPFDTLFLVDRFTGGVIVMDDSYLVVRVSAVFNGMHSAFPLPRGGCFLSAGTWRSMPVLLCFFSQCQRTKSLLPGSSLLRNGRRLRLWSLGWAGRRTTPAHVECLELQ